MDVEPRKRGRSPDGADGREKLLSAARDLLRTKPETHFSRKTIAKTAGLVPALVTYYFRDNANLIEAAARPVVNAYLRELNDERQSRNGPHVKFKNLVMLLLKVSQRDGQLLEIYIQYVKRQNLPNNDSVVYASYLAIDDILNECRKAGILDFANSAFLQTALWGVCKSVAGTPELRPFLSVDGSDDDRIIAIQADLITNMFLRAFQPEP